VLGRDFIMMSSVWPITNAIKIYFTHDIKIELMKNNIEDFVYHTTAIKIYDSSCRYDYSRSTTRRNERFYVQFIFILRKVRNIANQINADQFRNLSRLCRQNQKLFLQLKFTL
jgi:hypothetical protein